MSDTPKTDRWEWEQECNYDVPWEEHCRELERENSELRADKERLDWLEKYGATPICSRAAIDAARKEAQP